MVRARADFLAAGWFEPIVATIAELIRRWETATFHNGPSAGESRPWLADLGGGSGYYSVELLRQLPGWRGALVDASTNAVKVAARAASRLTASGQPPEARPVPKHDPSTGEEPGLAGACADDWPGMSSHGGPRLAVACADLWAGVPLATNSIDIALDIFAPRHPAEIGRVLRPVGLAIVVTPRPDHLHQLRQSLPLMGIEADKESRLRQQFSDFRLVEHQIIEYGCLLPTQAIAQVISMGPNGFHASADQIAAMAAGLSESGPINTRVAVDVWGFGDGAGGQDERHRPGEHHHIADEVVTKSG
jgi:23S rRNA (guanine745-N1)-methyltransferase/23S rRNA (guanine748-N1)-methyltransferase